ncbi:MAG: helix-hairpin-helix domain-containing protein [Burkholderiaceae bacterium]
MKTLLAGAFATAALAIGAAAAPSAIDANHASLAEIERIKGVGTALAANLLEERNKAAFKDWDDLIRRVKGIGPGNAVRFSAEGLTVNGARFQGKAASAKASEALPGK